MACRYPWPQDIELANLAFLVGLEGAEASPPNRTVSAWEWSLVQPAQPVGCFVWAGSHLLYARWVALPSETCEPHAALVSAGRWSVNKVLCIKEHGCQDAFDLENLPHP